MNELTGAIPAHLTESAPVVDKTTMGKDDFMKLLMAQLQNQDPLNPMDHKEFGAQLAQFASLEKLTQIGGGIEKLEGGIGEGAKMQAFGMIGRRVIASGAEINLVENQPSEIQINQEGGFKPLKVSIFKTDGKLVRELELDPRKEGKSITWDGKSNSGEAAPTGKYLFRVTGVGKDGKSAEMQSSVSGKVVGVEMVDNAPMLLLATPNGQVRVELTKIQNVGMPEEESKKAAAQKPVSMGLPSQIPVKQSAEASPATNATNTWSDNFLPSRGMDWSRP